MQNEMREKLQELLSNEDYVQHLLSLGSAEAISKEFEKEDIDISPDEIRQIGTLLRKKEDGELSDEELEEVAGGSVASLIICAALFAVGLSSAIAIPLLFPKENC